MRNNFSMAQCLFNEGRCPKERINELLTAAQNDESLIAHKVTENKIDTRPVRTAVIKAMGDQFISEREYCVTYMEVFIDALRDVLGLEVIVDTKLVTDDEAKPFYGVSQSVSGDISLAAGVLMEEAVYLKIASRYCEEELLQADEDAEDSIAELINVINGLFSVELANDKLEVDLNLPRVARNVTPHSSRQLQFRVYTLVGDFQVVLGVDEFL